jgi:hypothetical protein
MTHRNVYVVKPKALPKERIALFSPASRLIVGHCMLVSRSWRDWLSRATSSRIQSLGYFEGTHDERMLEFVKATQQNIDG